MFGKIILTMTNGTDTINETLGYTNVNVTDSAEVENKNKILAFARGISNLTENVYAATKIEYTVNVDTVG